MLFIHYLHLLVLGLKIPRP